MKYIKRITLLFTGIVCMVNIQTALAQHELTMYGGGGVSTLHYKPAMSDKKVGSFGGQLGLGYNFYFNSHWAIGSGYEFVFYNGKTKAGNLSNEFQVTTPVGLPSESKFYLQPTFDSYEETQKALYLNIPIMVQYQVGRNHKYYVAGGIKFGIPLSSSYDISAKSLIVKGYSDFTGQYYEEMPSHGFMSVEDINSSGDLNLKIAYIGSLETGVKWRLSTQVSLYTGAYIDYGFNNVRKENANTTMVVYNETSPTDYTYNSMLQSQNDGEALIDKVFPLSFGVKVKLSFSIGEKMFRKFNW